MKPRSFRLRIALLSALLTSVTVAGFGIASWLLIYGAKLNRLDSEIKGQLLQQSFPPRPIEYWQSYEKSLASVFGWSSRADIALLVIDIDGNPLHKSDNWNFGQSGMDLFPPQPPLPPLPIPPGLVVPPDLQHKPLNFPRISAKSADSPSKNELTITTEDMLTPDNLPSRLSNVVTLHNNAGYWRVGTVSTPFIRIATAVNLRSIDHEMRAIENIFLISVPLVLALVAIGAWIVSGSILKPIHEVTSIVQRVTVKGLDQRIPISTTDIEFVELIEVFNHMMERLERSFKQASRFSADAAHELKTPLAILQGELERSLQQADLGSQQQQTLSNLIDEVRRLGVIVRKLLLLSLADAGQMRLQQIKVNLSTVLANLVDDMEMLAPHLDIQAKIAPALYAQADEDLLLQVLHNLIDNAIKYNLPEGWVRLNAFYQRDSIAIVISNRSNDIPISDRQLIFDRFHRADPARTRQIEGVGLGLSLSREIARAHGGDLRLDPTPSGQTSFTLTLPVFRQ